MRSIYIVRHNVDLTAEMALSKVDTVLTIVHADVIWQLDRHVDGWLILLS